MLTIEQHAIGFGITVIYATGRITLGRSAQELEWAVDELVKQQVNRVIFDFAGVEFLDSTGVGIVVMCAAKLKDSGGALRMAGATGVVHKTLDMCRVSEIVPMYGSVEEAAESFGLVAGAN